MGKTITFGENRLLALKDRINEIMVGTDGVSHNVVSHDINEASAEVDEFELGQESDNPPVGGNYCHVEETIKESYGNKISNIDLSEVGEVVCEDWTYDEEEYQEWLVENELQDTPESKRQYIEEEFVVEFDITYLDNQTYHPMGGDWANYDDLVEVFGEKMAKTIEAEMLTNGYYKFDIGDLYSDETYDINNPQELNDIAMKLLPHGEYYQNCRGFILTNGVIVYTEGEHNDVLRIPGINSKFQFIELGNIRILDHAVDIGQEPTWEQEKVLRQVIASYEGEEFYLDIFSDGGEIGAQYPNANYQYIMGEINRFYSEGIRPQGGYAYENKKSEKIIDENIDFEVNSSDIDLSSFKKRSELAPIWLDDDTLDSRVRLRLLDIADDFWEFVNLTWVKPSGIILTGSICNFNWSKYSDIDLHLIVDFDEIDEKTDFVRDYLDAKKNEWNNEHSELTILGFPVELYVQNIGEMPQSGGIYDLEGDEWLKKPDMGSVKPIGLDKFSIKDKAAEIMTIIDDMYNALNSTDDSHMVETIGEDAQYLWKKVKSMRKTSLERNGESGAGNIVYKILRRTQYLDKLFKLMSIVYDKNNSIFEGIGKYKNAITLLKEEWVGDGNSEHNPYKKRWDAERKALKDFVANYGKLMQSKENGKLYKCYYDKVLSQLIGYNYCICIQWDNIEMKPKSVLYIRALDKFTPNIKQVNFDYRGKDNVANTRDDFIGTMPQQTQYQYR
jgi:hypothetical protein